MSPRLKYLSFLAVAGALAACGGKKETALTIQTAAVERRTIIVQAEATGVIEPINVVEVKSRSSGQIVEMPVETGSLVRPGALIVQLDTRDVQNQFDQSKADLESAEKSLEVASQNKKRSDELFKAQIITAQENEQAGLTYQNALSQIVRARTNLDLAQQRLDDARVVAPVTGTIIEKPVALGQVIQSGTSAPGGLVNYVVKRAPSDPDRNIRDLTLSYGPGDNRLIAADLGGRFGPDAAFGYRFNVAHQDLNPYIRDTQGQRDLWVIALSNAYP